MSLKWAVSDWVSAFIYSKMSLINGVILGLETPEDYPVGSLCNHTHQGKQSVLQSCTSGFKCHIVLLAYYLRLLIKSTSHCNTAEVTHFHTGWQKKWNIKNKFFEDISITLFIIVPARNINNNYALRTCRLAWKSN